MEIGVDLGGTNMRVALVDNGKVLRKRIIPCPAKMEMDEVMLQLEELIASLAGEKICGIGLGVPSVVDVDRGIVYNVANIPSWKEVHLKQKLEERFSVPVYVNNDSNCFTLGVKLYGEGRGYQNLVGITIGTGIGAGLIIGDRLYGGSNTGAGEIGSLPYKDFDFEHYCSSGFFVRYHGMTGKEAAVLAASDPKGKAEQIWKEFGTHFGHLIKAVLLAYDPEAIILGGGIASAYSLFEPYVWNVLAFFPYPETVKRLKIHVSKVEDVALLGASALVRQDRI